MCHFKGMPGAESDSDEDEDIGNIVVESTQTDEESETSIGMVDDSSDPDFVPPQPSTSRGTIPTTQPNLGEPSTSRNVEKQIDDSDEEETEENIEEDEEDEVVKAIKAEREKKREHPPDIKEEDFIVDISFHPRQNILAVALITGDCTLYKYSNEENQTLNNLELHVKACRDIEFNEDGSVLYSCSKDKSIMLTDINTGKLKLYYDDAHEDPLYSIYVIDENMFSTGDESGTVKLWDTRQKKALFSIKKMEDFVSDMITNEAKKHLVCSGGDGSLTTFDLVAKRMFVQSEEYDEELTCVGLFKHETKLLAGTSKGRMYLFNWGEFGLHSDQFPGPKSPLSSMIPITENVVAAGYEDGNIRAVHVYPHRQLGIVGQHDFPIECLDISYDGEFIASCSTDQGIKFWQIKYFEDLLVDGKKVKNKRKDMKHNLPSSKYKNQSDFFSGLA